MSRKPLPQSQAGKPDLQHTLQRCNQLLQQKKFRKALTVCRQYLGTDPDSLEILNLAGTCSYFAGQLDEAERFFRRAIQLAPKQPWMHVNLANTLNKAGKTQEAISAYETALGLAPNDTKILSQIANIYANSGDALAAAHVYARLQNLVPNHVAALDFLEQFYKNALKNNPTHAAALENLGIVLLQMDRPEEAKEYFIRANRLKPKNIDIMINLAQVYYLLAEPQNAESIFRDALEVDPNNATLHYSLGTRLVNLGRMSEAEDSFRNAIRIDPTHAHAHQHLAYLKKHKEHDDDIEMMEEILRRPTLDALQQSSLNFGLGKAYEDLRDYDRAFGHYAAANDLKRSTIEYNIADDEQSAENFIRAFDTELFERLKNSGHPSHTPIFIVGMPRSGTTLVEQILSCHPDVHGAGELKLLSKTIRSYFSKQLNSRFPEDTEQLNREAVDKIAGRYLELLTRYNPNARHITNKMPHNFFFIGMIHLMFPNTTIIHCKRSPLDTCFSCYVTDFKKGQDYSYRLDELGQYYGLYYKIMQHWRQLDIANIIEITYEDLVHDQEKQTRRLLDACGLEWNDACLAFHKSNRPVMTASVNQVRDGLYNKSVERWKHFESHLAPLIESLGKTLPDINHI